MTHRYELTQAGSTAAPIVVATIAAVLSREGFDGVALTGTVFVDGVEVVPDEVGWLVNGAVTGITDSTASTTTFQPYTAGLHVASFRARLGDQWYHADDRVWDTGRVSRALVAPENANGTVLDIDLIGTGTAV